MVFSSLIFVFVFLPVQLLIYQIVPEKYKNTILLLFSIIFYCWSGPGFFFILAGESFISYLLAKKIQVAKEKNDDKSSKRYMFFEVFILLLVLIFFKYLSLLADTINGICSLFGLMNITLPDIVLPIGISFYTFQLISYVVDVYRGNVKAASSYSKVLLYAGLFHQCIAGPIVRYETIAEEIDHRKADANDIYYGVLRFAVGLFKKAVLANACAKVCDTLLPLETAKLLEVPTLGLWLGAVFYMLHIYLDFSAYSDMAIGMGRMVGFHYEMNFNYPYIAKTVTDFWRRWHISLSSFFRDYVYIPLGGNRVKALRHIFNLFIVWFLTGLWHGASANFIIWGLYYLVFLLIEKYILAFIIKSDKKSSIFLTETIGRLVTLFIVLFGWVIFRFDSFDSLICAVKGMFMVNQNGLFNLNCKSLLLENIYLLLLSCIVSTPLFKVIYKRMRLSDKRLIKLLVNLLEMIIPVVLIILASLALAGNSYNPFIYYRF